MRGYFGIGVEGISKEGNLGSLVRTAHAFGASFFFVIRPIVNVKEIRASDTSGAFDHMPFHVWDSVEEMDLPQGCALTGIEFMDESVEMPSFRHPTRGAYVLGPEMGDLSPELIEKCDHIVKIPSKFCINVGVAGALTMYDRMLSMGRFAERPVQPSGKPVALPQNSVTRRRKVRTKPAGK